MHFTIDHRLAPEQRLELEQRTRYMVDIGLSGDPARQTSAIAARCVRCKALRTLRRCGASYLSQAEFRRLYGIAEYEAVRRKYHADEAFSHIEEKVLSQPSAAPELAPTPLWRVSAFMHRVRHRGRGL